MAAAGLASSLPMASQAQSKGEGFTSAPPAKADVLTQAQVLKRHPGLRKMRPHGWDPDDANEPVIVLKGNHHLTAAWKPWLDAQEARTLLIVGDALIDYQGNHSVWATGDVRGTALSLGEDELYALGTIHSALMASLHWQDDEVNRAPPPVQIDTPLLLCWFYSIEKLSLRTDTVVILKTSWDYCQSLKTRHRVLVWNEAVHVLRDDLQDRMQDDGDDSSFWDYHGIRKRLQQGQPIFREGFDPRSLDLRRDAREAYAGGQLAKGLGLAEAATRVSPGCGLHFNELGQRLFHEGAYAQALPFLEQGARLFPKVQDGLDNECAFYAAMTALRLGRTRYALELATRAIEAARPGHARAGLFRARAEARMLLSAPSHPEHDARAAKALWKQAGDDLKEGLRREERHGTLNWLMARWLWQEGRTGEAEPYRRKAIASSKNFDRPVADHPSTAFLAKPAVKLDWVVPPTGK